MVAALCALHPINVENVAWVAEQKTMLSTIFFLLALGAYRWYSLTPKWTRMAVVTALFAIALLCKPQIVTFPFVLLLWDWWPLGRLRLASASSDRIEAGGIAPRTFGALLLEKVPLFLAAFAGSLLTMYAQRGMQRVLVLPVYIRLGNAILSYAKFLGKAFWPEGFALMYLHPGYGLSWLQVSAALVFLLAVTALVLKNWRHPYLITGWFWFIGTMIPTIGLVQVDYQALADRYAYVSFMGLFILVCWGISDLAQSRHLPRPVLPAVSLTILLVLAALTYRQAGFWSDKFTLWNHTLAVTHRNWVADYRLAAAYVDAGKDARALEYYYQAAQDRPREPMVNVQIALIEHKRGNLKQAIEYYRRALRYSNDPTINSQVLANLGHIYGEQGDQAKAKACFQQSLRITAHPIPGPCTN